MKKIIFLLCVTIMLAGCQNTSSANKSSTAVKDSDVDLTSLSATMVYSEVSNMISDPGRYLAKTIKMKGNFASYHDENTGKNYFACIIQDATACCQQGIEFELSGAKYPDDYPAEGEVIVVTGIFDVYDEDGIQYLTLRNAKLL